MCIRNMEEDNGTPERTHANTRTDKVEMGGKCTPYLVITESIH